MDINFNKFQATGNDFVIIDGRFDQFDATDVVVKNLCNRRFGVGADGLIILKEKEGFDFEMLYFNSDGKPSSMCGNGGRCAVQFAKKIGILKQTYYFLAPDGEHEANIDKDVNWVNLKMKDAQIHPFEEDFVIDTGSPHYVKFIPVDIETYDVFNEGRAIRNDKAFPQGINVNFVQPLSDSEIFVRTFERGVEDETLSCGTGVTASALAYGLRTNLSRIDIQTLGGRLAVSFEKTLGSTFSNVWLGGSADFVFEGRISL